MTAHALPRRPIVLLLHRDPCLRATVRRQLENAVVLEEASSIAEARDLLVQQPFDIVVFSSVKAGGAEPDPDLAKLIRETADLQPQARRLGCSSIAAVCEDMQAAGATAPYIGQDNIWALVYAYGFPNARNLEDIPIPRPPDAVLLVTPDRHTLIEVTQSLHERQRGLQVYDRDSIFAADRTMAHVRDEVAVVALGTFAGEGQAVPEEVLEFIRSQRRGDKIVVAFSRFPEHWPALLQAGCQDPIVSRYEFWAGAIIDALPPLR